jgi:putative transposase
MPRLPRYALLGQPQHVIHRGNNRCAIFASQRDRERYLAHLAAACHHHACRIHAYVLMTNHVHLLMTQDRTAGIGRALQAVGRRYVQYFNSAHGRTGTLWEGRYRATPVDTERYLLTCYRYIELNPVRAGLVQDPGDYHWSSHGANALGRHDPLVSPHATYAALGATARDRFAAYRALFQAEIDPTTLRDIRASTNKGWALGDDRFRADLATREKRRAHPLRRGRPRRDPGLAPENRV